ncbi:MAG: S-methyl-5-thioribose-1-phosphate isomerase [Chitinivibrionales bacterium]
MGHLETIKWDEGCVVIVDQTKLPGALEYKEIRTSEDMWYAIRNLEIRGAPAIGIAAAFGLYLGVRNTPDHETVSELWETAEEEAAYLSSSRPTAVNLVWALDRVKGVIRDDIASGKAVPEIKENLLKEAEQILREDNETCRAIGENAYQELRSFNTLLTHCNAGGLATGGYGTALSPVYVGLERGKRFHVYSDETRPLLQGSRITAFELSRAGLPVTVICDSMAPWVMSKGWIDAVIVGADRIASNGDTANKIGTYGLACAAEKHSVPFYVAAPVSTVDMELSSGGEIPIEERGADEIVNGFGKRTGPSKGVEVYNPAFDVTPADLITGIITERGVCRFPFNAYLSEVTRNVL